ncbi:O-antigen polysaccharide polymerase Wzy [Vibrio fortis]|uniref:O-antigen polysaccharide polymerase Wzy n=1 Tax=Vibrio fortis TaxID=212667 RepID=UPI003EB922CF
MIVSKRNVGFFLLFLLNYVCLTILIFEDLLAFEFRALSLPIISITLLLSALTVYLTTSDYTDYRLLFLGSFSLFIFGKFFAILFGVDGLSYNSFYYLKEFSNYEINKHAILSCVFLLSFFSGTLVYGNASKIKTRVYNFPVITKFLPLFSLLLIFPFLTSVVKVFIESGYLALYIYANNSEFKSIYSLGITLTLISAFLNCCKYKFNAGLLPIIIIGINAIVMLLLGQRSSFFSLVLFMIWYFSQNGKKLRISTISILLMLLVLFSQFVLMSRGQGGGGELSIFDLVGSFFDQQGVTFTFFSMSDLVESWPILPMIQNFIPGSSFLYGLFDSSLQATDKVYSQFYSNFLNSGLYQQGYGVGWSVLLDVKIISLGNPILFSMVSFLFGLLISYVFSNSVNSNFHSGLALVIVYKLFLLPRGGLNSLFPLLVYCLFVFFILQVVLYIANKKNHY